MSGILPGLALVNNFDPNGELMRGALLRVYQAGTNTPVTAFKDSALTAGQEHPWPIPADSAGRLPMFYLADGVYRVRLSSNDGGFVAYDVPAIEAVAPSGGGGGGGGTVAPEVLWQTGHLLTRLGTGILSGFARLNGRTIGNATSGATERANADTQALFEYLWNEFDNTICPVIGGRGLSATADYNAGKQLTLIDGRGRAIFGADGMGAARANRLTSDFFNNADTVGAVGGVQSVALTNAQMPVHNHVADVHDPGHSHPYVAPEAPSGGRGGGGIPTIDAQAAGATSPASTGITVTTQNRGGGEAHTNLPPGMIVTYYVKL